MNKIFRILILGLVLSIIIQTAYASVEDNRFPNSTPLQIAIKQEISNGNISLSDIEGTPEYSIQVLEKNESHIKLKSTTKITYKNPKGAGYSNNKWPKFEIKDDPELRKNGTIRPGDYDQTVKDYVASNIQNITDERARTSAFNQWNEYDFESGPRTEIIEETYEVTYPEESQSLSSESTSNGVLMGFTRVPHIRWIVEDRKQICFIFCIEIYYYKAGFELDAAYGLRLPTEVNLITPDLMNSGQSYTMSTSIIGEDWNDAKYLAANVPSENGNEFVARFSYFLGIIVRIAYINVIDWHIEADRDYGRSFRTPIGPNEQFPDLDLYLDPYQTGLRFGWNIAYLGIGLRINPDLRPDKISSEWLSNGDSVGNGLAEYNAPSTIYNFGPVYAGDYSSETNYANIRLLNFKYYFSQCRFLTDAFVRLHLGWTGFERNWDFPINLYTLDCDGSYLDTHPGTNANNINEDIPVTAPVIFSIDRYRIRDGSNIVVPLRMNTTFPIGAIGINISYNASVVRVDDVTAGAVAADQQFVYHIDNITGKVIIGMIDSTGLTTNGSIANITFNATTTGSTDLLIHVDDLQTPDNVHLPSQTINGNIEVYIRMVGDVDDDGQITVNDALLYLRYAVGQDISPYHIDVSDDVTCDGLITVADALRVLKKAVGYNIDLTSCPSP